LQGEAALDHKLSEAAANGEELLEMVCAPRESIIKLILKLFASDEIANYLATVSFPVSHRAIRPSLLTLDRVRSIT
jgi:hypothetical protein